MQKGPKKAGNGGLNGKEREEICHRSRGLKRANSEEENNYTGLIVGRLASYQSMTITTGGGGGLRGTNSINNTLQTKMEINKVLGGQFLDVT